jgi:hypothetical protein
MPVSSLREYMPLYCFAHSVNLYCVSCVASVILEVALLEMCAFAGNLMEIAYRWQSWQPYFIAVTVVIDPRLFHASKFELPLGKLRPLRLQKVAHKLVLRL